MFNLKITKMKKLFSLLCLVVLLGVSMNVIGQNAGTAVRPSVGDIFIYSVADHLSSTYVWTLEANATGGGTNLFIAGAIATSTGANTKDVTITWLNPVVETVYYLHVVETNAGCSNRKVLAIQPKNNFTLQIVNVDATGADLGVGLVTNNPVCAPAIPSTMTWNGASPVTVVNSTDFKYDYGTTVFYYKITAAGINFTNTTWTPSITIAQTNAANATVTIASQVGGAFGASWVSPSVILSNNATSTPTIPAAAGNNIIWVRVTVANGFDTPAIANENVLPNNFTFTLNAASKDQQNNTATSLGNITTVQSQSARPDSGVITTN
jgi:hypothetical protein